MDQETIIIVSVFSGAWLLLLVFAIVLCVQVRSLRRVVDEMRNTGRLRVQKLKMDGDKNHAFHNPGLSPDEELSKRGYSMYMGSENEMENGRVERQTGGVFVEDLQRELERRQQQSTAPPFLLQGIEENKRKTRSLHNPHAGHIGNNGRASGTDPNFIY